MSPVVATVPQVRLGCIGHSHTRVRSHVQAQSNARPQRLCDYWTWMRSKRPSVDDHSTKMEAAARSSKSKSCNKQASRAGPRRRHIAATAEMAPSTAAPATKGRAENGGRRASARGPLTTSSLSMMNTDSSPASVATSSQPSMEDGPDMARAMPSVAMAPKPARRHELGKVTVKCKQPFVSSQSVLQFSRTCSRLPSKYFTTAISGAQDTPGCMQWNFLGR
mmetsp:Transcript_74223/g.188368  ORF Transcript_74223/g.188368 Transcript_74223/m.188368 type:complete len:221 (-) Transcript_74223:885-1547(-)